MKIAILCPGSFTHGLDSPERGESRWAQNMAKLLGKNGHEVVAFSAGNKWGLGDRHPNVELRDQNNVDSTHFDIYIDPAWWEGKEIRVKADRYFRLKWSVEPSESRRYPENHFLLYPYEISKKKFLVDRNVNRDKTFFLPGPFGDKLHEPRFGNRAILFSTREAYDDRRLHCAEKTVVAVNSYLAQNPETVTHWLFSDLLSKSHLNGEVRKEPGKDHFYERLPYNQLMSIVRSSKLNFTISVQGCVVDCAVAGVPSIIWETEGFDFHIKAAREHGLLIEKDADVPRIEHVLNQLMTNKDLYVAYTETLQHAMRHHTDEAVLQQFNWIMEQTTQ